MSDAQNAGDVRPFTLRHLNETPECEGEQPPGYYDEEDQVWKEADGSLPDYGLTRAGSESTWDTTVTDRADSSGDHSDSD